MADFFYNAGKEAFGNGEIDWEDDTIKVVLCTSAYSASQSTHTALSDISAGTRIVTATVTGKTNSGGTLDASDTSLGSPSAGSTGSQYVFYKDTGSEATSTLILHVDGATGLPIATSGNAMAITHHSTGIATL